MKPFETLDSTRTADGQTLVLHRRESDYFIYLDGEELMSTRRNHSEGALADLVWDELRGVDRPRMLIGGLGLGFTLRAALGRTPPDGRLLVAELFPQVVRWNLEYMKETASALADPRVEIDERDVQTVIAGSQRRFDAILLDVDNGPSAWCLKSNGRLYDSLGLSAIRRALRSGGVLGIWSAFADPEFVKLLGKCGFDARSERVRARGEKGSRHTIFLARPS